MTHGDANGPRPDDAGQSPRKQLAAGTRGHRPSPGTLTGPDAAERLSEMAGELAVLSAAGSRWADLAVRTLGSGELDEAMVEAAREQLARAMDTLDRISGRVNISLSGGHAGEAAIHGDRAVTVGEAIDHAVEALSEEAIDAGAHVDVQIERDAGALACGVLYPVITGGLRNAIESVHALRSHEPEASGAVRVSARLERGEDDLEVVIEIWDAGHGPPANAEGWVFKHGYSTREEGAGIGLSLARSLVERRGGSVELCALSEPERGAVLRVRVPAQYKAASDG